MLRPFLDVINKLLEHDNGGIRGWIVIVMSLASIIMVCCMVCYLLYVLK